MHLSTYRIDETFLPTARRMGDGAEIDLRAAGIAASLVDLVRDDAALAAARLLMDDPGAPLLPAGAHRVAPIPAPVRNIFCVGKNYREHAREFGNSGYDSGSLGGTEVPAHPVIFSKVSGSVSAPGDPIPFDADPFGTLDYEGELAVIIGRGGRAIPAADAYRHVFGYTLINDVTARELQKVHKQWLLGKGADGFCPMGPVIVTADEIPDPGRLTLTTHVNGELRQQARVEDLVFPIPDLLATISRHISLWPGDIIATGTPAGVGIGFSPPRFLRPGDSVRVAIDAIGVLENPVR